MPVLKCIGGFHDGLLTSAPEWVSYGSEIVLPSYLSSLEQLPEKVRSSLSEEEPVKLSQHTYVVDSLRIRRGVFSEEVLFLVPKGTSGDDAIISLLTTNSSVKNPLENNLLSEITHIAKELFGIIREYERVPCESLKGRMIYTAMKYELRIFGLKQ